MTNQKPRISLCYTSVRPGEVQRVVNQWTSRARDPERLEWLMCHDAGDDKTRDAMVAATAQLKGDSEVVANAGPKNCVAGWNAAAAASSGCILISVSDDFNCLQDWDAKLTAVAPAGWWNQPRVVATNDLYVPDVFTLTIVTRARYAELGYMFYPRYESLFCLPAGTKIWMGNYLFKSIEDVKVGDEIIGSSRTVGPRSTKGQALERLKKTRVLKALSRECQTVKITLESGKVLRSTADHLWGNYLDRYKWIDGKRVGPLHGHYDDWAPAAVGRFLVKVVDIPDHPPAGSDRELGWLAGLYDGEGNSAIFLSQSFTKNRDICEEYERILTKYGFKFSLAKSSSLYEKISGKKHKFNVYTILGGKREYVRLINWAPSVRHSRPQVDRKLLTARYGTRDKILSIELGAVEKVFCLKTETGNYIADGYLSHNCDTEATAVAIADEVVIDARWLVFEHMHPDCGKRQRDDTDLNHASKARWERGELLFNYRKTVGFPLDSGPVAESRAGKPIRYAAVVQAIQDDFCLFETLKRLIDEAAALPHGDGLDKVFLFMPTKRWDGTVASQEGHDEVVRVASRLSSSHPGLLEVVKVNVDAVSHWNQPRIMVETDCRNFYSEFCRKRGFEHLLIVDGDELWRAGLMAKLCQFIRDRGWPKSVFTGMVPVAGLPGYPVDGAMDKATIYARSSVYFKECRGAVGYRHSLPGFDIYHFTATRRTMQEIADKHRNSGHKDDARYQMERWIQEVLLPGKIKPGLRNSHMYDLYGDANVWPMIRPWSAEEWAELPETVKPFLSNAR